jgi:hypothetical protein
VIGVDTFSSVFGGAPEHTRNRLPEHVRAIIRAGYSPVLCAPLTSRALCTLSPTMAKRTGPHPCGSAHVLDDPAKSGAIVKRLLEVHGSLNIALHLGRSRLAVHVTLPHPGHTVAAPDGAGYWWFTLPEGATDPVPRYGPGWAICAGDQHLLVPPARTPEGLFQLVGGTHQAPEWML